MARKCQVSAYEALVAGRPYKRDNDEVQQEGEVWTWRYHGKRIVTRNGPWWYFTDAGWRTYTTRERLKLAMWQSFGVKLYQKNFDWFTQEPGAAPELWTGARSFMVA